MLFGLELALIPIGQAIIVAAGAAGLGGLFAGATAGTAATVGGMAAAAGAGVAATAAVSAASTANPMIASGYQAAATDIYNNAVSGSSDFVNGLGLPFGINAN
jgi:hypothetical protein